MADESPTTDGTLYYTPTDPPKQPFRCGDVVDTFDRNGVAMERVIVTYAGPKVVRTSCGRRWNQKGEWFPDDRAWPFPTIQVSKL